MQQRQACVPASEEVARARQGSDALRHQMSAQIGVAGRREEELVARLAQAERQIRDMGASPGTPVDTSLRGLLRQWRRARRNRRRG